MTNATHRLPGPRGLPLLGNLLQLDAEGYHLVAERWADDYGDTFEIKLGRRRCVVLARADLIQEVLRRRPHDFRRIAKMAPILTALGGHGVFNAEGEDWKRQRRIVMTAFTRRALEGIIPLTEVVTERLLRLWQTRDHTPFDVHADLLRYTTDVTALMAFGHDLNTLAAGDALHVHLRQILPAAIRRFRAPLPYWRFLPVPVERATERAVREVRATLLRIIRERAQSASSGNTLLDRMLEERASAAANDPGSDEELAGNVLTLLLAGEDTTGNTLAWLLYYAAQQPALWRTIACETERELGDRRPTSVEELRKLSYLGAAFKETLRLRSPAPVLIAEAVHDLTLGPLALSGGTLVMLLTRRVGLRPDLAAPHQLRPERWLPGGELHTDNADMTLAFGSGPRACPGRVMAEIEAKMVISALCRHFVPALPEGPLHVTERFAFTMEPHGLRLSMRPRDAPWLRSERPFEGESGRPQHELGAA